MRPNNTEHIARSAPADAARVAAAFFVVMIHASGTAWPQGLAFNALSRFGVPVFVILSGYFMLSRARSPLGLIRRCARLAALMLLWSAVYYVYNLSVGDVVWSGPKELLRYLLTEPVHLWYIYTTVALYALTPLFGVFCEHAGRRQYEYALLVSFVLGCVVTVLDASAMFPTFMIIVSKTHVAYAVGFTFFYLLGGYLRRYPLPDGAVRAIYALGLAGLACTVAGTLYLSRGGLNELLLSYTSPNVAATAAAFTLFFLRRNFRASPRLSAAARCTLGVYLLHPLLILIPQHFGIWEPETLPLFLAVPLRTAAVYALSLLISLALSRVPGLRRLVS